MRREDIWEAIQRRPKQARKAQVDAMMRVVTAHVEGRTILADTHAHDVATAGRMLDVPRAQAGRGGISQGDLTHAHNSGVLPNSHARRGVYPSVFGEKEEASISQNVRDRIGFLGRFSQKSGQKPSRSAFHRAYSPHSVRRWVGYTSVAVLIGVVMGIKHLPNLTKTSGAPSISNQTYTTANGQRAVVTLGDGSRVTLAPATSASIVASKSNPNSITVLLRGEALFDVTPQSARAFKVEANGVTVSVLGTTFGVRAYAGDKAVRVGVKSGRVSVPNATLAAGDLAMVAGGETEVTKVSDMSSLMSWEKGVLRFDDVPLGEVIPDLSRWFDVDIKLSDATLGKETLKGAIPSGSRADLARLLSAVTGMRAELSGRVLTLHLR